MICQLGFAQSAETYFEKIRNNEAELTAFFAQMPKGGDLHHHYSGSIYAEPLLAHAIAKDFYLNTLTMTVSQEKQSGADWVLFSTLQKKGELDAYKQKIIQKWSAKDYNNVDYPSDKLFFESFMKFEPATQGNFEAGLLELKNRAIKENVSYIETQLSTIPCDIQTADLSKSNSYLRKLSADKNEKAVMQSLDSLYTIFIKKDAKKYAADFNENFVGKNARSTQNR